MYFYPRYISQSIKPSQITLIAEEAADVIFFHVIKLSCIVNVRLNDIVALMTSFTFINI